MGLKAFFRELFEQVSTSRGLADSANVAALVPLDAGFVTVGPYFHVADLAAHINEIQGQPLRYRPDVALSADQGAAGLLVLAGQQVRVITAEGEQWRRAVTDIEELVAVFGIMTANRTPFMGCAIATKDGGALVIKGHMPVRAPDNFSFKTVPRMTNNFSHWDAAFEPYGVTHRTLVLPAR